MRRISHSGRSTQELEPDSMAFRWNQSVLLGIFSIPLERISRRRIQWAGFADAVLLCRRWPAPAIRRHSSAHRRQASAQRRQCSMCLCFSHSRAHSSQTSAHSWQKSAARSLPRAITIVAVRQISAHSRSSSMQRASIPTSCSFKQAVAQCSHSSAHSLQASMQLRMASWVMVIVSVSFEGSNPRERSNPHAIAPDSQHDARESDISRECSPLHRRSQLPRFLPCSVMPSIQRQNRLRLRSPLTLDHGPAFRLRRTMGSETVWT
jgi:hypothetical protein